MDSKKAIIAGTATTIALGLCAYVFRNELLDLGKMATTGNYFTIDELCASATAKKLNINNTPNETVKANLQALITNCLNPVREAYGKPIKVSSGYRCTALNTAINGAKTSQHLTGCAADLVPASGGNLADIFKAAIKVGGFDQLIYEKNSKGSKWVHISYDRNKHRGDILAFNSGVYTNIKNNWQSVVA